MKMKRKLFMIAPSTEVICSLNRDFLERAGTNLYTLLFAFQEELVDATFEREGKLYRIATVELGDNKIIAFYFPTG